MLPIKSNAKTFMDSTQKSAYSFKMVKVDSYFANFILLKQFFVI